MEFRVLDEVVEVEGKGLILFTDTEDCKELHNGCTIRDVRGNTHTVNKVNCDDMMASLFIRGDHIDYFQRLLRDVSVDATLFTTGESEAIN